MISVTSLTLSLNNCLVLDNINAKFEQGSITGLIGRNGSGKTVLMKCICGFFKPDVGTISVGGKVVGRDVDFPEDLGIIIESPGFLGNFSGYENLNMLAMIRHKIGKKEISASMELVGLDPKSKKKVSKYSLGMKQRLGISQAIMEDPNVIILDEPMNSLDVSSVEDVREIILRLKSKGKTIILSSHNKEDIDMLCDKTYFMKDGKIVDSLAQNSIV